MDQDGYQGWMEVFRPRFRGRTGGITRMEEEADVELLCRQGIWVYELTECPVTRCVLNYHCRHPLVPVPQGSLSLDSDPWNSSLSRRPRSPSRLRRNHVFLLPLSLHHPIHPTCTVRDDTNWLEARTTGPSTPSRAISSSFSAHAAMVSPTFSKNS